jgi:hypothetical protein
VPALAHLAPETGDLPAVEVDVEVVPVEAFVPAILAGGVAWQRPADGDLVLALGSFQVDQGGVSAVDQVLGGQQPATGQAGVNAGQGLAVVGGGRGGGHVRNHVGAVGGTRLGDMGGQLQGHGVLEVVAAAHRLGGLTVRQVEQELQHTDGGQLGG